MTESFFCLGLGEVLWDLLPDGPRLGGAPANFAHHIQALGGRGGLVSRLGDDAMGHAALRALQQRGIDIDALAIDATAPTGTVTVRLDGHGSPAYEICADVAWDRLAADAPALRAAQRANAVCFGTLAQRTPAACDAIRTCLLATQPAALRVLDLNLRSPFWTTDTILSSLALANVLKCNDDEWPTLCAATGVSSEPTTSLPRLAERFGLRAIALTMGARGSLLWMGGAVHRRDAEAVAVVDTIGAGDGYAAALVLGLLAGMAPHEILAHAHRVAAYVCSQPGAMPTLPPALRLGAWRDPPPL